MNIFIDESGTFTGKSISVVGALTIPNYGMRGFEKLYGRLRASLPKEKGEVKGRLLSETQIHRVATILKTTGCLFECVAIDFDQFELSDVTLHKTAAAEGMTKNLTESHQPQLVKQIWEYRARLEAMPQQLYCQSVAVSELIYHTINHSDNYYALRRPTELAEHNWIIDAKDKEKLTPWEEWWSTMIPMIIESKSFKEPFFEIEGADFSPHAHLRTEVGDFKRKFMKYPEKGVAFDIGPLLKKSFRFSAAAEFGLEASDILTNAIRRAMIGNLRREGWLPIRELMIHRIEQYIRLISLAFDEKQHRPASYLRVIDDFRTGGRPLLTNSLLRKTSG